MDAVYTIAIAYLLGSIPFGLILTRLAGAGDLRAVGSGNIGATNVLRTGRKGLAAATLVLDAAKGAVAVLLATRWTDGDLGPVALAGLAALIGHCYPIWLKFKGGKGVATMLGVALAFDWRIGAASALAWLLIALLTKISSLGGIAAAVAAPVAAFVLVALHNDESLFGVLGVAVFAAFGLALATMAAIVIWQHRANLARLRAGTEPRIGSGNREDIG